MAAEAARRVLEAVVAAASPSAGDDVRRAAAQYAEEVGGSWLPPGRLPQRHRDVLLEYSTLS